MPGPAALDTILARHPAGRRDGLVPLLLELQAARGWLVAEEVERIADHVGVPGEVAWNAVRASGNFRLEPPGRWPIRICVGTSCQVRGASATLAALESALGVSTGRTTADGVFSLDAVPCFGACGFAPVLEVAGRFRPECRAPEVPRLIDELRGAPVPDGEAPRDGGGK